MNLHELKEKIDNILQENPSAGFAEVLVDTEARCYNYHMVNLEDISFDPQMKDFVGYDIVTLVIDTTAGGHHK